jgi:hypothetical protein
MGEYPSKATQFKSGERVVEIGRKGGQVRSDKKKIAAHVRALTKWGMTKEAIEKVDMLVANADLSVKDYYKHIARMEKIAEPDDPVMAKFLMDYKEKWHKMIHGDKINQSQINIQVNIDTDKKESIIKRLINEGKS